MKRIAVELCYFILCEYFFIIQNSASVQSIILSLLAFCIFTLPNAIDDKSKSNSGFLKVIISICTLTGVVIAIFFPSFIFMFPMFAFDIWHYRQNITGPVFILVLIYGAIQNPNYCLIPIILSVMAFFIEELLIKNNDYQDTLIKIRDTSKEYELLMEEKNQTLIANQDNEIITATLSERNRIAREIHDNVGHMLTRSLLQIGALKAINKDNSMIEPLNNLHATLDNAMTNIRKSVHDLHDESVNFESALSDILKTATNFTTKLDADTSTELPRQLKYSFINIAKEAVNNAIKHSSGDFIEVTFRNHPGFYQLLIYDNGTSADIDYSSGIGLSNMEERVRQINGNIRITTDKGFSILVTVMKSAF